MAAEPSTHARSVGTQAAREALGEATRGPTPATARGTTGTRAALIARGRPVLKIDLPRVHPEHLGELLRVQQLPTALAGALYGVDPFTQPGVEAGEQAALRILSS